MLNLSGDIKGISQRRQVTLVGFTCNSGRGFFMFMPGIVSRRGLTPN